MLSLQEEEWCVLHFRLSIVDQISTYLTTVTKNENMCTIHYFAEINQQNIIFSREKFQ